MVAALRRLPVPRRLPLPRLLRSPRLWGAIVVVLAAGIGGWLWLRDSGLVGVEQVTVSGATGPEAGAIVRALDRAAREMTTLHVDRGRLRAAVAVYPQVKDLRVQASPLHRLRIDVIERPPVAALVAGGQRTPVAADGTLLRGRLGAAGLPSVRVPALPAGGRLTRGEAAVELGVLAAAPAAMRRHVGGVRVTPGGLVAQLDGGPRILLGTPARARAKWVASARVLGDPGAAGATYIDVRLPDRPAAGGFPSGPQGSTGG